MVFRESLITCRSENISFLSHLIFIEINVTQVLKVIVHTEPKVMIELHIFIVMNGMLKSLYVQCIMF